MQRAAYNSSCKVLEIPISKITRSDLLAIRAGDGHDEEGPDHPLADLIASIRKQGVLQPIIVRPVSSGRFRDDDAAYEIVCGNRRFLACRQLGLETIPAMIRYLGDREALEVALIENVQRESLNPIEEAEAFKKYVVNYGRGSMTSLAARIGKSEEYVSHRLLLLGLPKEIVEKISRRLLKPGQACELVWLKDQRKQIQLAERVLADKLSFRQTRAAVKILREGDASVNEAVRRAAKVGRRYRAVDEPEPLELADAWENYQDDSKEQARTFKHAILILRACLSGLDALIDRTESQKLRATLLDERSAVHESLDRIVRAKVAYRKQLRAN